MAKTSKNSTSTSKPRHHPSSSGAPGILKRRRLVKSTKKLDNKSKKKFQCDVCFKKFNLISELRIHQRIHTVSEKLHICPVCNSGFTRRYGLKLHSFKHTRDMTFNCDMCDFRFTTHRKMTFHKREAHIMGNPTISKNNEIAKQKHNSDAVIATKSKSFNCDKCKKIFTEKSKLSSHKKNVHSPVSSTVPVRKGKSVMNKNVKPVLGSRDRAVEPSTSQASKTTEVCLQSLNLSPEMRAQQWSSFLNVFNAKVVKEK